MKAKWLNAIEHLRTLAKAHQELRLDPAYVMSESAGREEIQIKQQAYKLLSRVLNRIGPDGSARICLTLLEEILPIIQTLDPGDHFSAQILKTFRRGLEEDHIDLGDFPPEAERLGIREFRNILVKLRWLITQLWVWNSLRDEPRKRIGRGSWYASCLHGTLIVWYELTFVTFDRKTPEFEDWYSSRLSWGIGHYSPEQFYRKAGCLWFFPSIQAEYLKTLSLIDLLEESLKMDHNRDKTKPTGTIGT